METVDSVVVAVGAALVDERDAWPASAADVVHFETFDEASGRLSALRPRLVYIRSMDAPSAVVAAVRELVPLSCAIVVLTNERNQEDGKMSIAAGAQVYTTFERVRADRDIVESAVRARRLCVAAPAIPEFGVAV